ncbi:iron ABC transporter permease [Fusibacter sp. 3D3]|uniref:FecCD family ABC transporter permease n=1 Tax=Fusibacter sp. 3D3 TaxID=1048380 RepID=UPI000852C198|nr:iron ABC transporter permease [Fusibacter sp. 3D3]GAU77345.1 vitamin B12 ABC transporter, permease component BtuC [Fusibacter sp. 3D3]
MNFIERRKWNRLYIGILLCILVFVSLFAITQGSVKIPVSDVFRVFVHRLNYPNDISDIKGSHIFIIENIRLPRIVMASIVGGVLSIVGASFQAIFKNPMADPFVMGVSSGAAFGATMGIAFGLTTNLFGFGTISTLAFLGALGTVFIVYSLARVGTRISTTSILLAGIVMNSLLTSIISLVMIINQDDIARIVTWTMGSFNGASWDQIAKIVLPSLIGFVLLMLKARDLNAIVMGEEDAKNMGVNVELTKKLILIYSSFLIAFSVAVSGIIGFVGLIIPHLFRIVFGADHRTLLPVSFFGGAIFLTISDTLARSLVPNMEVPVGIITAVFGGPFFLYLLSKNKKNMV